MWDSVVWLEFKLINQVKWVRVSETRVLTLMLSGAHREQRAQRNSLMTPYQFYLSLLTENGNVKKKSSGSCNSFFSAEIRKPEILITHRTAPLIL